MSKNYRGLVELSTRVHDQALRAARRREHGGGLPAEGRFQTALRTRTRRHRASLLPKHGRSSSTGGDTLKRKREEEEEAGEEEGGSDDSDDGGLSDGFWYQSE